MPSTKQPIGLWVFNNDGKPELIATLSVRAFRAREAAKHQPQRVYGRRPFLARITAAGQPGDRISSVDMRPSVRLVGHAGNVEVVAGAWKAAGGQD